ncbi:MAG: DUF1722 domain-containing protein [Candidatus Tectomicrobia bacterium]|uniref:DUF1722 domain-containing protein n=1 Tax=Tectimicrobiota bacterium TaxID=2528274 RepID=A0A933E9T0_UNCTE|nr:DUF1722 domain-containing protein [Candidatus Tectomicrobia bacterium]
MPFPRPIVVLSQCLELAPCRWDGERIPFGFLRKLEPYVELRPVCPEVEIGLGVPRDPIRIVQVGPGEKDRKFLQPSTGRDLTRAMRRFAGEFLGGLGEADGFILKSRSPSCGIRDVKMYGGAEDGPPLGKGAGLFAGEVLARFPGLAVEDEARLAHPPVRERFLTRLFALAAFRAVREKPSAAGLARFQEANRLLLMARGRREAEALGEIAANRGGRPLPEAMEAYETRLRAALARPARRASVAGILRRHAGAPWLAGQTFFAPFPAGLAEAGEEPDSP